MDEVASRIVERTLTHELPMASNRVITGFFQQLWRRKMHFRTENTLREREEVVHQVIDHWARLANSIVLTDNLDGQVEKAVAARMLNLYERNEHSVGDKVADSFNFNLPGEESVAGKIWTGNANCVQWAMVAKALIKAKCGADSEIIYSLGGRAPWLHAALKTTHGFIVYGKGFMATDEFGSYFDEYQNDLGKAVTVPKFLLRLLKKQN